MKIIFAGTPEFAVPTLQALLHSRHQILAVYTQPDRPAGRGQKMTASPVKQAAFAANIPVFQPVTLRDPAEQQHLQTMHPDVMVVVAYGLILPEPVLTAPRDGCINVHASLLPRWRGAAPIQRAILAGDSQTGVTIMQMDRGLDTGAMLAQVSCPITAEDTSGALHERLAVLGAQALLDTVEKLEQGLLRPQPQDNALACYAPKIDKAEARIDWSAGAIAIHQKIRAFNPWPVAFTTCNEETVRIWQAMPVDTQTDLPPGTIIRADKNGIAVATGDGVLQILVLQIPGGRPVQAVDFLNAKKNLLQPGQALF